MSRQLNKVLEEARLLDQRRQVQITNQLHTIDRLMDNSDTLQELRILHELLATIQVERDEALRELREASD